MDKLKANLQKHMSDKQLNAEIIEASNTENGSVDFMICTTPNGKVKVEAFIRLRQ